MTGAAYYNEFDPYAAEWLRRLIAAGEIPAGEVDTRSIVDVRATELVGYTQCHFFAGIGGWPLALRMAGWSEQRPAWTGSCPCQPFAVSQVAHGGAKGQDDSRHLWPVFSALIRECRPAIVFGEQVASAVGWGWWDEVCLDLEPEGYACGAAVLRADAIGADHQRKRLYWCANAGGAGRQGHQPVECLSVAAQAALPQLGDPFSGVRRALAGDHSGLLFGDGVSVQVERLATHGYGNAIVPQVAQAFIESVTEIAA